MSQKIVEDTVCDNGWPKIFEIDVGGIILERLVTIEVAHDVNSASLERKMGTSDKQNVVLLFKVNFFLFDSD